MNSLINLKYALPANCFSNRKYAPNVLLGLTTMYYEINDKKTAFRTCSFIVVGERSKKSRIHRNDQNFLNLLLENDVLGNDGISAIIESKH